MFNKDSRRKDIIHQIYRLHSRFPEDKSSIPRLVIIGDQSSGKSSTLESMTQLPFPHGEGMCPRFAIQVNLRRNTSLQEDVLMARIEGEDGFNKRHKNGALRNTFRSVIDDATKVLCGDRTHISDKVLEITLTGPTESPLTVIDLPVLINTGQDDHNENLPQTIRNIITRHIKEPRTIILAVVPTNNDYQTSTVFSVTKEHGFAGERNIPIVTKPTRNSQQWMSVILNQSKAMKLGYLVMSNKTYEDDKSWEYSRQKEVEFFKSGTWYKIDPKRKGCVTVAAYCQSYPVFIS